MPVAPTRALSPPTRPTPNHQCSQAAGSRLGRGATGRLGQGFGPRLLPGPGPRRAQAGGGGRHSVAGAPGRVLVVSQTGQQQEQQTAVVRPGDGDALEDSSSAGSTGDIPGDQALPPPPALAGEQPAQAEDLSSSSDSEGSGDAMNGQPPYRQQGLPSSRSDTMLLQSAEQGRFGMLSGGVGGMLGFGRSASGSGSDRRPAGGPAGGAAAAAAGAGQQPPGAQAGAANSIPVFVMLPLDTVNADGVFRYAQSKWFSAALQRLASTGIRGVAVDVWWGAVERRPRRYDWAGYRQLFSLVRALGLRLQVVMSFHACGGNVGDNAQIPLPQWVLQAGESDPDIFFTDRPRELFPGQRNRECLSFFADEEPGLLRGRSPMQCYVEFMRSFRDEFSLDLGGLIEEVVVGCGPCGELRYPSYPEANGWRFPGVGEFQCYDRRALASLAAAAREAGHPEWGNTGPHDTGSYNSSPEETGFFCSWGGNWETDYGRFFLEWYSGALLDHGERMLTAATSVFNTRRQGQRGWGPAVIGGGRSRSLPDLPGSSAGGGSGRPAHQSSLPPLPGGAEDAAAAVPAAAAATGVQQQEQQQQEGEVGADKALLYSGDAFDAGLVDSYRLQQQQHAQQAQLQAQQLAQQAQRRQQQMAPALQTSPLADMLPAAGQAAGLPPSGAPSPLPPPFPGTVRGGGEPGGAPLAGGGMGMRQHASFSSLRSSVSESEEWMGEGGAGCCPAGPAVDLTLKVAGVHWWYRTRSHAAELTAGYYNTDERDGYGAILQLCARHGVGLTLTCVEMCDAQHPPEALCGPEGLLRQVRERAAAIGVSVAGENALPCFMPNIIDETALHRIVYNTQPWGTPLQTGAGASGLDPAGPAAVAAAAAAASSAAAGDAAGNAPDQPATVSAGAAGAANGNGVPHGTGTAGSPASSGLGSPSSSGGDSPSGSGASLHSAKLPPMRAFTFLRLTDMMMTADYQRSWAKFMRMMSVNAQRFRTSATWRRGMGFE